MPPEPGDLPMDQPQNYSMPAWMGPPDNWLPGLVPVELTLGQSETAVVHISGIRVYPEGFQLAVLQGTTDGALMNQSMMGMHDPQILARIREGGLPDELMRFGLEFSDGSKVTSIDGMSRFTEVPDFETPPSSPVLMANGGGGGGTFWEQAFWCWPIPPSGDIRLVCEWPSAGIERTSTVIDADLIIDTAKRAQRLWDEAPPMPSW